jgi:hypothetical protein
MEQMTLLKNQSGTPENVLVLGFLACWDPNPDGRGRRDGLPIPGIKGGFFFKILEINLLPEIPASAGVRGGFKLRGFQDPDFLLRGE